MKPEDIQLAIEQIESAFANVRLEDGVSLREADVIDDYGRAVDRAKARARDELHDWRRISDDLISKYYWCLSFFDGKGLRFHLPAYMRFTLRHFRSSDSMSIDSTIYALGRSTKDFGMLDNLQREAVRQFLRIMSESRQFVDARAAKSALEDVWKDGVVAIQADLPSDARSLRKPRRAGN
jgi:hypothetical protein